MTENQLKFSIFASLGAMILSAGCSGGSSGGDTSTGVLNLSVSDAPVQGIRQVCIEFDAAEFKKSGSSNQVITFNPAVKIDLLAYQGMNAAPLVIDETLEAGEYQWVRLAANAPQNGNGGIGAGTNDIGCLGAGSYVVTDAGAIHGMYIPSAAESGLKLNRGFTLPVGGAADFIAEFDLLKSVHAPEGPDTDYIMRPTVRLLDRTEVGSISGEVSMTLATAANCMPAVYLYNSGETPDDNESDDVTDSIDPIASAMVSLLNDGRYTYEIGPVLAGTYDVAFSCDPDDPIVDETLDYVLSQDNPVDVFVDQQATANF